MPYHSTMNLPYDLVFSDLRLDTDRRSHHLHLAAPTSTPSPLTNFAPSFAFPPPVVVGAEANEQSYKHRALLLRIHEIDVHLNEVRATARRLEDELASLRALADEGAGGGGQRQQRCKDTFCDFKPGPGFTSPKRFEKIGNQSETGYLDARSAWANSSALSPTDKSVSPTIGGGVDRRFALDVFGDAPTTTAAAASQRNRQVQLPYSHLAHLRTDSGAPSYLSSDEGSNSNSSGGGVGIDTTWSRLSGDSFSSFSSPASSTSGVPFAGADAAVTAGHVLAASTPRASFESVTDAMTRQYKRAAAAVDEVDGRPAVAGTPHGAAAGTYSRKYPAQSPRGASVGGGQSKSATSRADFNAAHAARGKAIIFDPSSESGLTAAIELGPKLNDGGNLWMNLLRSDGVRGVLHWNRVGGRAGTSVSSAARGGPPVIATVL